MLRPWLLFALAASACTGCTMLSLERHTVYQVGSVAELRYLESLYNLAAIAEDPSALPNFSSMFNGSATVQDQGSMTSTTIWQHVVLAPIQNGYGSEAVNPSFNRQILENWTLDPVVVPEKLEAMRCCCQWEIYGPGSIRPENAGLLDKPDGNPTPGRHFGIKEKLERIPPGWLHVGKLREVPLCAAYKAHCRDTWVWVMPDGVKGLADFTIILENVARVSIDSPTILSLPPTPSVLLLSTADSPVVEPGKLPGDPKATRTAILSAKVSVDACGRLTSDTPYYLLRTENMGSDSALRSQVNAANLSPPIP